MQQGRPRGEIVVVTFHGGAEGSDKTPRARAARRPSSARTAATCARFTHAVVDAGADLVVGHGPHVMRGMEFYKGRLIAYRLGNFAGYEVFSLGGRALHERRPAGDADPGRHASASRARSGPPSSSAPGTPAPGGDAIAPGARRSRSQDFGPRAPRIDAAGTISAPR